MRSAILAALLALVCGAGAAPSVTVRLGPSRQTIVCTFTGSDGQPATVTAVAPDGPLAPTISVAGASIPLTLPLTSAAGDKPYVIYPLTAPVPPESAVAFSAPAGWATTTVGPAPALADAPVTTGLTTLLKPFDATTPKTMGIGYTIPPPGINGIVPVYADLMKQAADWGGVGTFDANGWPLTTDARGVSCVVSQTSPNGFNAAGLPNLPWGTYTILWDTPDGKGDVTLGSAGDDHFAEDASKQALAVSTSRQRVYSFTSSTSGAAAPTIGVSARGNCRNIRIYPPGVPTDGSALFGTDYLAMLAGTGAASLRTEAFVPVNTAHVVDYEDFPSTTQRSYSTSYGWKSAAIASVVPAPAGENYGFFTSGRALFVVETATPHGFKTGHVVQHQVPSGGLCTLANGEVFGLNAFSPTILVIDATHYAAAIPNPSQVASITPPVGGTVVLPRYGAPPEHAVALANAVPGAVLHFNVAHAISDDAAATLFRMIATTYDPKRQLRVELSNEPWNGAYPYEQSSYFGYLGVQRGLNGIQAYVQRSSEVWAIAEAAFVAAGRPSSQVIRVLNSIAEPGTVNTILAYATAPTNPKAGSQPIRVDELMTAPYWKYVGAAVDARYNFLTPDMVMDCLELAIPGQNAGPIAAMRGWLDAAGFYGTKVSAYEGGPATLFIAGDQQHLLAQSMAANLHPRLNALGLAMWQEAQDAGCTTFHRQGLIADLTGDTGTPGASAYTTFYAHDMRPGVGDGSDGLFDNRVQLAAMVPGTTPPDFTQMASPLGGSIKRWNKLVAARPPPPTPTATARFVGIDLKTQGAWQGVYGSIGYVVPTLAPKLPSGVTVTTTDGTAFAWPNPPVAAQPQALLMAGGSRCAPCWYSGKSGSFTLAVDTGGPRRVSLFCLDWDGYQSRNERITIRDAGTGAVLDSQVVAGFTQGKWLSWDIGGSGGITITATNLAAAATNAVVSGVWIDPPSGTVPVVVPTPTPTPPPVVTPTPIPTPSPTATPTPVVPVVVPPSLADRVTAIESQVAGLLGVIAGINKATAPPAVVPPTVPVGGK